MAQLFVRSHTRSARPRSALATCGKLLSVLALALSILAGCRGVRLASVSRDSESTGPVFFHDGSVFDGTRMVRNQDVLFDGDKIVAVGETGTVEAPSEALRIEGKGRTLLPGLIDSHVHLFSAGEKKRRPPTAPAIAEALLFAGITTAIITGGTGPEISLAQRSAEGRALAPRLYLSGPGLTASGGHPIPLLRAMIPWPIRNAAVKGIPVAETPKQARQQVQRIAEEWSPEFLKIIFDDLPPAHLI